MPVPPGDPDRFDKVNYIVESFARPCQAPWYIYLETLKPALLTAFIVLITFGWDDVLRGVLRPKGLGRRTGKRKGKWGKRVPRFPELGETIGKHLPFAEQVDDFAKWGCGTRTLWRIDTAIQMTFFYWLVADVTVDLFYDWNSALFKTRWCEATDWGRFSYENTGWSPIPNDTWKVAGFGSEDYEDAPPSWTFIRGHSGPAGCQAHAALRIKQRLPFDPPQEFRVVIWNEDKDEPFRDFDPCGLNIAGDGAACASAQVPPNTSFQVRCKMSGTPWADIGFGNVAATGNQP